MKTKYPTMRFRQDTSSWRCEDSEANVLGDVVQNQTTGKFRFLSLGSVFLDGYMCHDITDFLRQLNKEGKPT